MTNFKPRKGTVTIRTARYVDNPTGGPRLREEYDLEIDATIVGDLAIHRHRGHGTSSKALSVTHAPSGLAVSFTPESRTYLTLKAFKAWTVAIQEAYPAVWEAIRPGDDKAMRAMIQGRRDEWEAMTTFGRRPIA